MTWKAKFKFRAPQSSSVNMRRRRPLAQGHTPSFPTPSYVPHWEGPCSHVYRPLEPYVQASPRAPCLSCLLTPLRTRGVDQQHGGPSGCQTQRRRLGAEVGLGLFGQEFGLPAPAVWRGTGSEWNGVPQPCRIPALCGEVDGKRPVQVKPR